MNVFDLYAKIALDTGDYEKGLEEASGKTSSFADKLKTGLATAAKVGAAGLAAAAAGVAALTKDCIDLLTDEVFMQLFISAQSGNNSGSAQESTEAHEQ